MEQASGKVKKKKGWQCCVWYLDKCGYGVLAQISSCVICSRDVTGDENSLSLRKTDNHPTHTALNVRLWCLYNCPQNLKTPPQSPDLNPMEHIWRELEVTVRKHDIKTESELKTVMMEDWMNIDAEITKILVKSIPKRLNAVVDGTGYPTKY
ncbi:hypothetical protein AVEN_214931-1 [Araneus ventricosus]|uniref:Tc1-like transposase DDE domain-containing protein n=1 Tax=Araneus ventricosus TaxID=182803 RepID=A0A4Y2DAF2_ARAVE|nr:hypothetical protein AVEN_214931-1 [Araneus ventricosus]